MNRLGLATHTPNCRIRLRAAFEASRIGAITARKAHRSILEEEGEVTLRERLAKPVELKIEQDIRRYLEELFPGERVIGEESSETVPTGKGYEWIIDPIDGTDAYCEGKKLWSVSVGMWDMGRPCLGAVLAPDLRVVYQSVQSNSSRTVSILTRNVKRAEKIVQQPTVGFGWHGRNSVSLRRLVSAELGKQGLECRWDIPAALGLAWVAEGDLEVYYDSNVYIWDIAASAAISLQRGVEVWVDSEMTQSRVSGKVFATSSISYRRVLLLLSEH